MSSLSLPITSRTMTGTSAAHDHPDTIVERWVSCFNCVFMLLSVRRLFFPMIQPQSSRQDHRQKIVNRGLYVCTGGLYIRAGGEWHSNLTKIPLIMVFHISIWGSCVWGDKPNKLPRGDRTVQVTKPRFKTPWKRSLGSPVGRGALCGSLCRTIFDRPLSPIMRTCLPLRRRRCPSMVRPYEPVASRTQIVRTKYFQENRKMERRQRRWNNFSKLQKHRGARWVHLDFNMGGDTVITSQCLQS